MNWQDYIVSDKEILLGKPTIKGTRISVEHVVGLLAQGWSEEKIERLRNSKMVRNMPFL